MCVVVVFVDSLDSNIAPRLSPTCDTTATGGKVGGTGDWGLVVTVGKTSNGVGVGLLLAGSTGKVLHHGVWLFGKTGIGDGADLLLAVSTSKALQVHGRQGVLLLLLLL